jgi:hypothetical protein
MLVTRKEFIPCRILFVRRPFVDLFIAFRFSSMGKSPWSAMVIRENLSLPSWPGINGKNLIFFVLVKTHVNVVLHASIGQLTRAPDEAALFQAFFAQEQHSRCFSAIRPWVFFLAVPRTREVGTIRNRQANSAIRFNDVNSASRDDSECSKPVHVKPRPPSLPNAGSPCESGRLLG